MASLEGLGGRLAAVHMQTGQIKQIRKIHNQMVTHYQNYEVTEYFETNRLIHELITEEVAIKPWWMRLTASLPKYDVLASLHNDARELGKGSL